MHSLLVALTAWAGTAAAFPRYRVQYVHPRQANGTNGTAAGTVQFIGTNIAGFDFGCGTDGTCDTSKAVPPLAELGSTDGVGQMQHFAQDDGMNTFRLPVGWQWLVNNQLGGDLDANNLAAYDKLLQGCLATGATCIIDIHNYARWNGQIVGQGGPTNDQLASLWSQLAEKYAGVDKMAFGVMNEPHDVPDIDAWADTVQAVVTAIRSAGAAGQMILLPGNDWTSAAAFPTTSGPALLKVTNPDGSTDGLVFDVHKYLDQDNSGTHTECVTDNVADAFSPLADWLRANGRQAFNSETGGGNTASCEKYLCQQVKFLNDNSDVFVGYTGWSAGAFDPNSYELSEVPTKNGGQWTDSSLVKACLVPQ